MGVPPYDELLAAAGLTWLDVGRLGRYLAHRLAAHPNDFEDCVGEFHVGIVRALPKLDPARRGARGFLVASGLNRMRVFVARQRRHRRPLSLDAPLGHDDGDGDGGRTLSDALEDAGGQGAGGPAMARELRRVLDDAVAACLSGREAAVLDALVMGLGTVRACTARLAVTRARLYQIRDAALGRLRRRLVRRFPHARDLLDAAPPRRAATLDGRRRLDAAPPRRDVDAALA